MMNGAKIVMKILQGLAICLVFYGAVSCGNNAVDDRLPNVIMIYTDDVGYGDVSCYGATQVSTPNIDKLAAGGIRFTNGHCSSATCTPSRYSMLTGQYAWREKGTGIARGDATLIIDPNKKSWPDVMQAAGYTTGVVGKWHLGLGAGDAPNWNSHIVPGPAEIGFDYSFLIPATGDRVPCVYVENQDVVGLDPNDPIAVNFGRTDQVGNEPTGLEYRDKLKQDWAHGHNNTIINGISRIGFMAGGKAARWVDEDMADVIAGKAVDFMEANADNPFFLYFSTHDIHVPRVPHQRFVGKTTMGPRGDAIVQMDWCVGEILDALDRLNLTENTIVMFSSDNGPVLNDGYKDDAVEKLGSHKPAGPLRGGKYSAFDAGTRVPYILRWPAKVTPAESDALVSQVDFFASFAAMLGVQLNPADAPDSFDEMDVLLGKSQTNRDHVIEHNRTLSIIQGDWKYIHPNDGAPINRNTNTEMGLSPEPQLYNLKDDLGETNNLAAQNPEITRELADLLQRIQDAGRSR
jgi:arylsulfatase A-like enzyme